MLIALTTDAYPFFITCYNYKTAQSKKKDISLNTEQLIKIIKFC